MTCDILIIGGDGDLAYRKLYPALYHLDATGCLAESATIIGIARTVEAGENFPERVKQRFLKLTHHSIDEAFWPSFAKRLHFMVGDATQPTGLNTLRDKYLQDESRTLIVYLATPPSIFAPVCQSLAAVGLVRANTRIVVEKPLGSDLDSFLAINASLMSIFKESQVFRIDHYLGKETVQNLLALRFGNALFEPLWNSHYIDHVQITVAETVGIEGRWSFYDQAGAMRDMVQNHLLQLLCLVAMEPPAKLDARDVHEEKLKVLRCLKPMDNNDVRDNTVRGQYQEGAANGQAVPGYLQETGAQKNSTTETFVAIKAEVHNWRWESVPFYLRTGKRMLKRCAEIVIQFNAVPHSIFGDSHNSTPNRLVIRLQPNEGIQLQLLNKAPGLDDPMKIEPVSLNLSLSDVFTSQRVPDAYERLLFDVIRNNSTLFMQADQLQEAWRWVDRIVDGWSTSKKKMVGYPAGSWGPSDSIALIAKDGRTWYEG